MNDRNKPKALTDLSKRYALRLPGKRCAPITLWGNPVLREVAQPVKVFDKSLKKLVDQLFETMYAIESGVGLAANQIGRTHRVFVFDCRDGVVGYVINPSIEARSTEIQVGSEGCLSLPGFGLETSRAIACRVVGQDVRGDEISYEGTDLRARCFQHEVDHLDGRLYIDHHDERTRFAIASDMRKQPWFGTNQIDPSENLYRRAQVSGED